MEGETRCSGSRLSDNVTTADRMKMSLPKKKKKKKKFFFFFRETTTSPWDPIKFFFFF